MDKVKKARGNKVSTSQRAFQKTFLRNNAAFILSSFKKFCEVKLKIRTWKYVVNYCKKKSPSPFWLNGVGSTRGMIFCPWGPMVLFRENWIEKFFSNSSTGVWFHSQAKLTCISHSLTSTYVFSWNNTDVRWILKKYG